MEKQDDVEFREEVDGKVGSPASYSSDREEYEALLVKFDKTRENALMRKIDWRLLPVLALFYLLSYMDRTNMGNARLQGLEKDLGLSPQQYNWYSWFISLSMTCLLMRDRSLTIFFFPYSFFEVPSNLVLKLLKPSVWLPIIMLFWGTCMMCMG